MSHIYFYYNSLKSENTNNFKMQIKTRGATKNIAYAWMRLLMIEHQTIVVIFVKLFFIVKCILKTWI